MLLSREIADFTRGESDNLRKAMGKKLIDKLNHMYPKFLNGGKKHGYDPSVLEKIWEDWRAFASYAFNKSHATCYSWVAYQTAYLKANFPSQYMAGVMSRSLDNITDITKFMEECKSMGIKILGPDINESVHKFSVNSAGEIRFGLAAIKGVGDAAVDAIVAERRNNGKFTSVYNFFERNNFNACNRKCIENMILAGAFDSFKKLYRENYFTEYENSEPFIESLLKYGQHFQLDKQAQTNTLFGDSYEIEIAKPKEPKAEIIWSDLERLNKEKDLIGIYISGHPLDKYYVVLHELCTTTLDSLQDKEKLANQEITFGGILTEIVREGITKNGKPYGIIKIEDYSGATELALFGEEWANWKGYLFPGNALYFTAKVEPNRFRPDTYELRISSIQFLTDVKDNKLTSITININIDPNIPLNANMKLIVVGNISKISKIKY